MSMPQEHERGGRGSRETWYEDISAQLNKSK